MLSLPNELLYLIFENLDPLYLINTRWICKKINLIYKRIFHKESFRNRLRMRMYELANDDLSFSVCISSIINTTKIYNQEVVRIIKDIYFLVKSKLRYFGMLGMSTYYFYLYYSPFPNIINLGRLPNIYDDVYVVNLYFHDLNILRYYLETFLDFKKSDQSEYNTNYYRIKNYRIRYIL